MEEGERWIPRLFFFAVTMERQEGLRGEWRYEQNWVRLLEGRWRTRGKRTVWPRLISWKKQMMRTYLIAADQNYIGQEVYKQVKLADCFCTPAAWRPDIFVTKLIKINCQSQLQFFLSTVNIYCNMFRPAWPPSGNTKYETLGRSIKSDKTLNCDWPFTLM
jgi:hypothetical protein